MAGNSKIEWTEATWNPIVGCSIVSPGCTNCYAMKMAGRLDAMGQPRYVGLTRPSKAGAVWTGEMRLVDDALTIPLRRKKPTTWFVNSMSDLFHESVPDAWIDRVFAVMKMAQSKASVMGLAREPKPQRTPDEVREAKRRHMADRRAANPDAVRQYQREYQRTTSRERNARLRAIHARRLFWSRALRLKAITARDLAALWKSQRGLCALTGRKLDRTAEIDHRLPKTRGGGDEITNLQWVTREANRAKRDLTDEEFHALCSDVMRWIGHRIAIVDGLATPTPTPGGLAEGER